MEISSDGTKVEFDTGPIVDAAYEREYSERGTTRKIRISVTKGDTEFLEGHKERHSPFDIYRGAARAVRQNDVSLVFVSGMEEALDDADLTSDFFV